MFQWKSLVNANPVLYLILSIVGAITLISSLSTKESFRVDSPHFQLTRSPTFNKIVSCSDVSDGTACFQQFRLELEKEAHIGMDSIPHDQLQSCLDFVGKNANDLSLLLNIQTCFHQADILSRAIEFNESIPKTSWFVVVGVLLSLFIQVFTAIHSFVTFLLRNEELVKLKKASQDLSENLETVKKKQLDLYKIMDNLALTCKSDTKNIQGRLNRGGDIRREIERLNQTLVELREYLENTISQHLLSSPNRRYGLGYNTLHNVSPLSPKVDEFNQSFKEHTTTSSTNNGVTLVTSCSLPANRSTPKRDFVNNTESKSSPAGISAKVDGQTFNLGSVEGRARWLEYIQEKKTPPKNTPAVEFQPRAILPNFSITMSSSTASTSSARENSLYSCDTSTIQEKEQENKKEASPTIADNEKIFLDHETDATVQKYDKNGKPYRRLFIPGKGWVAARKVEVPG